MHQSKRKSPNIGPMKGGDDIITVASYIASYMIIIILIIHYCETSPEVKTVQGVAIGEIVIDIVS